LARLIYSAICSLDGYIADPNGNFDWAVPDPEVHQFVNDQERSIGTYLYGRRMYEVMSFWESAPSGEAEPSVFTDYAEVWKSADKIVFSRTLSEVHTGRTTLRTSFEPAEISQLKETRSPDISIGGPNLAAEALRAGLVDQVRLFLHPISIGSGKPALPIDIRVHLDLVEEHRFGGGVVYLAYTVRR
jgi:dihydrofolate reductase